MKNAFEIIRSFLRTAAAVFVATAASAVAQQEIGFIEEFALAGDRGGVLKKLIPGTEDYYYFHALHFQNTRNKAKLGEILTQWEKRFPNSGLRRKINHREALINYPNDHAGSLDYLRRELGLNFNHQQEGKAQERDLKSALDQGEIAWAKYLADALRNTQTLERLDNDAFHELLSAGRDLTGPQRRDLLSRAALPDLPRIVDLVLADLNSKESRGFGEFGIHRALTIAQLDDLRARKKDLLRNENFVHGYLSKLRPGADVNPLADPAAREAYLERAWAFAQGLEASFNSLRAHLLYQRLRHDRAQGKFDEARFMEYIKLPRNVHYVRPEWRRDQKDVWRHPAEPGRDFQAVTGHGPIGIDEPLVRAYLLHFLKDAPNYETYAPYFAEGWLKAVFAEAKIVNGVGDPEQWASLLPPAAFQALKERVDIEFDPTSPEHFGIDETVKLRVDIKNVETLIVKVFEVNTLNYYLEREREVSTDLDLDGLVANHERTINYKAAPQRRIEREFEFPEIEKRRGVWVVEFIGGSKSSRAVIRRGKLTVLASTVSAGKALTVLDEAHQPLADAAVWFGGRRVPCDEQGRALIPFSTNPGMRTAVVEAAGGFAMLANFQHPAEDYVLHAGIQVVREALRPGAKAELALRPTLTVAGRPISLERLHDVRLEISSTDLDGVSSTVTIPGFGIFSDREATHEFRVPDRLARLAVTLKAKLQVASQGGEESELSAARTFEVNGQLRTDRVDDLYLSRIDGRYILELLGRTGEERPGIHLNVALRREGFKNPRRFTLKTDASGQVDLGALEGIEEITAEAPGGHARTWRPANARRTHPGVVHAVAGEPVRVPFFGKLDRAEVALLAASPAGYTADVFGALKFEKGFLVAEGLAAGDYRLLLKRSGTAVTLRVAAGEEAAGFVFNRARILELPGRAPAQISTVKIGDDALQIEVANGDGLARVHLVATRFLPEHDPFESLGDAPRFGLYAGRPARLPNLFVSGRKIGDEFRYILERRYAKRFPGNMLQRPEILLNPWAVRDTEAEEETLADGDAYDRKAPGSAAGGGAMGGKKGKAKSEAGGSPRTVDFLRNGPATLLNLQPGENGQIRVDLAAFGDRQHLHILLVHPEGDSYQELSLPDRETEIRDLRLLTPLDSARHFTEQDSVTLLKEGETLEIPDILSAKFEVFDDLGAAYRYLLAIREDPVLREFSFVVRWPGLEDEEKRALYSKYACHELSFFLARKDPDFFKAVVVPHLANKRDRTFLDEYSLEAGLNPWFAPFEYERLNVLERILLARRNPDRLDAIRMDLRDRLALTPPDLARVTAYFEGAIATGGLTFGRQGALDEARETLAKFANALPQTAATPADPEDLAEMKKEVRDVRRQLGRGALLEKAPAEVEGLSRQKRQEEALRAIDGAQREFGLAVRGQSVDAYANFADKQLGELEQLYRAIETTKEWAENNYYRLPIEEHTYALVPDNRFWLDLARHDGEAGFGSRHLGEAARSVHEMLLALAVLDLPFVAPEHKEVIEGAKLSFTAGGRSIAFHREIREAEMAENPPPLLVSQSYFRHGDRHRIEDGEQVDKFVTDEFVTGVVYGGQVVVTNPTSSRQKLDVLIQIPMGALPVLGNRATATRRVAMDPYTTQRFEIAFYFPAKGRFPCYPAHVSKNGKVVAHAEAFEFNVVDTPSKVDEDSWDYISQWGTEAQVLEYLATRNLHMVDLARIAWRCRDSKEFFAKVLAALDRRGIYDATLYSYGIMHDHAPAVREFLLLQAQFLDSCGSFLRSELVVMDPVERRTYQHLEYKPLVNNRAHPVGGARKILNARIRTQYQDFLRILSEKATPDNRDELSATYYLFLQDRTAEALSRLQAVNPEALPTRIQYDYFRAYASFYEGAPAEARTIAADYANYPVDRWRERFATVAAQADEIEGKAPALIAEEDRDQQQQMRAAEEPTLDLKVDGGRVNLAYRNVSNVQINYYEMDLEFLFSTNPFVSSEGGSFSIVQPNKTERLQLADDKSNHSLDLPREYQSKNVLVEVIGGGKKRSEAVFSNELHTAVSERYGVLTVRHAGDDRPLPAAYVKVYALTGSGPKFYKDGYTDLRGKFDFASVSTTDIADASKFSILVMSDDHGATVLEAPVPQR